jgi:hypothetical protein
MRRSNANLVDPEFRRLVWVHIVDGRGKADYLASVQSDSQVVSGIVQKLRRKVSVNSVVEDTRRDASQDVFVS